MKEKKFVDLKEIECQSCNGLGKKREYVDEADDIEHDKLPSAYLATASSKNKGFIIDVDCDECEGEGVLFQAVYK